MDTNSKKILIVTGGSEKKLEKFVEAGDKLGLNVTTASFFDLSYLSTDMHGKFVLRVKGEDVTNFDRIYIRMVGKRLEVATLLAQYAKEHGIRIVDRLYEDSHLMPVSLAKSIETKMLIEHGVSIPKTFFGRLTEIEAKAPDLLGFPFVIKSTSGQKAREVWSPKTSEELHELVNGLHKEEQSGKAYFAQEFLEGSQRIRAFVLGGKTVAAVTRPTKWRKRFLEKNNEGEFPGGIKKALNPIPDKVAYLAAKAAGAVGLDIAGVDLMETDKTHELFVIEVNAAPAWKLVHNDTGMNVEEEILKFLIK